MNIQNKLDNMIFQIEKMNAKKLNNYINSLKKEDIYELLNSCDYEYRKTLSDFLLLSKKDHSYFKIWETLERIELEKLDDLENGIIDIEDFSTYELYDYYKPRLNDFKEENEYNKAIEIIEARIKELNTLMMKNEIAELLLDLEFTDDKAKELFKKYRYNLFDVFIDLKERYFELDSQEKYELCKGEYIYHPSDIKYLPPKKLIVEDLYSKMLVLHGNTILLKDNFYEDFDASDDLSEEINDLDDNIDTSSYIKAYKMIYN